MACYDLEVYMLRSYANAADTLKPQTDTTRMTWQRNQNKTDFLHSLLHVLLQQLLEGPTKNCCQNA